MSGRLGALVAPWDLTMKILMLGWELPPYNSGGLGVACYHLARALAQHGASIDFVLPHLAEHDGPDFMTVHTALPASKTTITTELTSLPSAYTGSCSACREHASPCPHADISGIRELQKLYVEYVDEYVRNEKPAVIHAHDWLTLEAGMRAKEISGAPLIAHVHATEYDRVAHGSGNSLIHEIEQHGLMAADQIIAVSEATKRIIVERYQIPADKIDVIHNSSEQLPTNFLDAHLYTYINTMKQEGYLVVAAIGRLTIQKGFTYFLRAAAEASARFERFIFVVAGDGDQRDELIAMSAELGIADKVLFTGFVRGKAWRDIYSLADVFVMSSVSEPFGLTALEAAQHDTAITLTKQSGVGEILSGVLRYDYWDTTRLADQLVNLATSQSLRNELAHNVAIELSHMSWGKVAQRFMDQYERLRSLPA